MRVVFVHGACVRDGDWWWHRAAAELASRGVTSLSPGLPSCGETGHAVGVEGPGLVEDVSAVRHVLASSTEPTVVVAHSYGGIVVAEAAAGLESVRHLLLVSSYLPEPGESLSSFGPAEPAPFLVVDPGAGTLAVRAAMLGEIFMHDCPADVAEDAVRHLATQSVSIVAHPVRAAAWREIPSTYLVCTADRGTPADSQRRFARRASRTVELATGHHPFLADPKAVADLVVESM